MARRICVGGIRNLSCLARVLPMTVRADLDTIRAIGEELAAWAVEAGVDPRERLVVLNAALDRLAGCVILTREEAARLRDFYRLGEVHAALLDARLGETK